MTCEQENYIQKFKNTSLSMDDVLAKLRAPLNRLHHDGTGGLVVGQERTGKGSWRTKTLIIEKISLGEQSHCWPWIGSDCNGYGMIGMSQGSARSMRYVAAHRIVFSLIFGSIPSGLLVRHKCDNPICVNPFHLEPGTTKDNSRDMVERGRRPDTSGDRNPRRKLLSTQIPEIRAMIHNGKPKATIARQFNVAWSTIDWIARGKNWSTVQ